MIDVVQCWPLSLEPIKSSIFKLSLVLVSKLSAFVLMFAKLHQEPRVFVKKWRCHGLVYTLKASLYSAESTTMSPFQHGADILTGVFQEESREHAIHRLRPHF